MMFWCSANNERIARSKLSIALDAAGLDEADYFNPSAPIYRWSMISRRKKPSAAISAAIT
ncbi:hypothetical protein NMD97_07865 [Edwardsiella tarda]